MIDIEHEIAKPHRLVEIGGQQYWHTSPITEHTLTLTAFGHDVISYSWLELNRGGNDFIETPDQK